MRFLIEISNSKNGIEIGTFTGYSALCMAEGLPSDGRLLCLDISEDYWNVGLPFIKEAGVADKIDFQVGPALDKLD